MNHRTALDELVSDIQRQLDTTAEQLDPTLVSKLDRARREALAKATAQRSGNTGWWKTPYSPALAAGFALAIFIAVINTPSDNTALDLTINSSLQSDLEWVLSNDDLELLEEDLEFYLWLEHEAEAG